MELQGRDLKFSLKGEDVGRLQRELGQLDLGVDPIPEGELQGQQFDDGTHQAVMIFQRTFGITPNGIVDPETARAINAEVDRLHEGKFIVRGHIRQADGTPHVGMVRVFDKDMRSEEELGNVTTDRVGYYELTYTAEQFQRAEKGSADLRVCACNESGREIATSSVVYNAKPVETIDLVLGGGVFRGASEYDRYVAELTPLMQGIPFEELREDPPDNEEGTFHDLSFLSHETGLDPQHIAFLILAHRRAKNTSIAPEVFYGMFRKNLPTDLTALLAQHPDSQRRALEGAVRANIIPASFGKQIDAILKQLKQLITKHVFETSTEEGPPSLTALLSTSLPAVEQQEAFVTAYVNHEGSIQDFWKDLGQRPEFAGKVEDLQFTLQLGKLTNTHLPLVKELQRLRNVQEITSVRDLARFDEDWWKDLIARNGIGIPPNVPGEDDPERRENYARSMTRIIEDTFPTAVIVDRVGKDDLPDKESLVKFFSESPEFEFATTHIDTYLLKNPSRLDGVANTERFTHRLKSMQRIFRLTPRYGDMRALLSEDLSSAQQITRMGQHAFLEKFGEKLGGQLQAKKVYAKAHQAAAIALTLLGKYGSAFHTTASTPKPISKQGEETQKIRDQVLKEKTQWQVAQIMEAVPNWQTLFGPAVLCQCEHCRSVYSPAAYLVDILWSFLTSIPNALSTLSSRRPDIEHVELSCVNTNTLLPYVDLVNEVLENAVSPLPLEFTLGVVLETELDNRILSPGLIQAFATNGIALSNNARVVVETESSHWILSAGGWRYSIKKEPGQLVVSTVPQTRGTPEELSANPEYINHKAYDVLGQQVYPFDLPFNLWMEEGRTYLEHLGVPRFELMAAFHQGTPASALNHIDIASEYLGLTTTERHIITGNSPHQAWEFWGLQAQANIIPDPGDNESTLSVGWVDALSHISLFLQKTGLGYNELVELLDTTFINPTKTLHIAVHESVSQIEADTCDPQKLIIVGIDEPTLDNMLRFIRLWRILGWTMVELDQTISALVPANLDLDDPFLLQLSHIQRLRSEFNVPLVTLLSWWALMDTADYADENQSLYEQVFLNKAVMNPIDQGFELNQAKSNLQTIGNISDNTSALLAGLAISEADLSLIIEGEFTDTQGIVHDDLTLENLSHLYRIISFSKSQKLTIPDLLTLKDLMVGATNPYDNLQNTFQLVAPFDTTLNTWLFVERVRQVRASKFNIGELNYLFQHELDSPSGFAPTEQSQALILDIVRVELQAISKENTFIDDPTDPNGVTTDLNGDLTKQKLSLLNWDSALIDEVVATLNDGITYRANLPALPPQDISVLNGLNDTGSYQVPLTSLPLDFVMPLGVKDVVTHNPTTESLQASRRLSPSERSLLLNASTDAVYLTAIQTLFLQQDELQGRIDYKQDDQGNDQLIFAGVMTQIRQAKLKGALGNASYHTAIDALFAAPRTFVSRNMFTYSIPKFEAPLVALPGLVKFPTKFNKQVYFDSHTQSLHFIGAMNDTTRNTLLALSSDQGDPNHAAYQQAVQALYAAPDSFIPDPGDTFLTTPDVAILFDNPISPKERFESVLKKLLPYLRTTLSEQFVTQNIAETLRLEIRIADALLKKWVYSPVDPEPIPANKRRCIEEFLAPNFVESNPNIKLTTASFLGPFLTLTKLYKISLLLSKFKVTVEQLTWLFEYGPTVGWLNLNTLPLTATSSGTALFAGWERLVSLFQLRDRLPSGVQTLSAIFALARDGQASEGVLVEKISVEIGWKAEDVQYLVGVFGLTFPSSYQDEQALWQLMACFALVKRLGVSAEHCHNWAAAEIDSDAAHSIKRAAKAKYENAQWLALAKPLRDVLREKQRAALVSYLVHPTPGIAPRPWKDANGLYEHFLIDVEMDPCMMTSRLKQTISSVQLFVQRCLINLEPDVGIHPEKAEQWKWMKNYRVWEANRKVFLYPENWIEPEWRLNKSPFFKELETQLLQNEVTVDTAETAFLNYLEKLDEVARLEIVGMYHQVEYPNIPSTADAAFAGPGGAASLTYTTAEGLGKPTVDILHVFGRTHGTPPVYYYRQRVNASRWSAWEKVDVDIEGNHLIPVVWNRRLYLFWPVFTEKTAEQPALNNPNEETQEHKDWRKEHDEWEEDIKDKEDSLNKKKVEIELLQIYHESSEVNPDLHKQYHEAENDLLDEQSDLELSLETLKSNEPKEPTSSGGPQFPRKFWEIQIAWSEHKNGKWSSKKVTENSLVNKHHFNKKYYYFKASILNDRLTLRCHILTTPIGEWWFLGCNGLVQIHDSVKNPWLAVYQTLVFHETTSIENTMIVEIHPDTLFLPISNSPQIAYRPVLERTPGTFRLLPPHQDPQFAAQRPFFYQDVLKTFVVTPQNEKVKVVPQDPDETEPELLY